MIETGGFQDRFDTRVIHVPLQYNEADLENGASTP